jgi:hypothetical protein
MYVRKARTRITYNEALMRLRIYNKYWITLFGITYQS